MRQKKIKKPEDYHDEGDVKKEIKNILNEHKWFWWMPPGSSFGKNNVDFNCFRGGVILVIEAKKTPNTSTPLQLGFLESIQAEDGFAFVVDEERIEWFRVFMEAFDRSRDAYARKEKESPEDGAIMLDAIRYLTKELS